MPCLLAFEQYRPAGQVETPGLQGSPQIVICPSVTQLQPRSCSYELSAQRKLPAEGAAAVVNENQCHFSILAISPPIL